MSAEIVNLRQARKRKARDEKERAAAQARAAHGRSGAEKKAAKALDEKLRTFLDGHRRDTAPDRRE